MAAKPLWKVTIRYGSVIGTMIGLKPTEETKVYRWRWMARLAAFHRSWFVAGGIWSHAEVEPYWPNSNVVPFKRAA